ncbi:MAG TPA: tripartite tricarboxylate transporter substrate binding protein [Burkholderiales bacterium]|nr:tripartite tricarboxylate transporter substrate binding protein [Burkholderiales bacterium]
MISRIVNTPAQSLALGLLVGALAWLPNAGAQEYPTKPIRLVITYPPGGNTDLVGRALALKLGEFMGQQVVVDNRGGAGGVLGSMITAQSAPDGYTIMLGTSAGMVINPLLSRKLTYDPVRDFAPVSMVVIVPQLLVINPQLPVKNVRELIAFAKAKPGYLNAGSSGVGTPNHFGTELLKWLAGVDIVHVPYKGGAPALTDLLGGQIQMAFSSVPAVLPHIKAGRLVALGVGSAKRSPALPNIPTIAEAGVPGYEYTTWYGIFAPAKTPRTLIARLNTEIVKAMETPDIKDRFTALGGDPDPGTPEELRAYMANESAKWAKIIKAANVRIE